MAKKKETANDLMEESIQSSSLKIEDKETEIQTSKYVDNILSDKELEAAKMLQAQFKDHLEAKFDIVPDYSIRSTIPTGIDLMDVLLGGGVGTGLVQIIGTPGAGKSALAAKIVSTGQRKYGGKFHAVYIDGEDSTDKKRLYNLGVRHPVLDPYTGLSVEGVFKTIDGMCTFKEDHKEFIDIPWMVVWDSIANTQPEAALNTNDPNSVTGLKARMLAHLLPKYVSLMNKYNISLVAVNQLRDKIDMGIFKSKNDLRYLADKRIPGGQAALYNSIQIIYMYPTGDISGEYGFYGSRVSCKMIKNKLFSPNIKFDIVYSFQSGFNNLYTNHELLKRTKRIEAASWCKLKSCPETKFQQKGLQKRYNSDPIFKEAFDNDVKDVLKTEYIDVYENQIDELE